MSAEREAWDLFRTDGAGQWEPIRTFERLDEACRCIMQLEACRSESISLTVRVRAKGPTETELEFGYVGRKAEYRITNSI